MTTARQKLEQDKKKVAAPAAAKTMTAKKKLASDRNKKRGKKGYGELDPYV